MKRSILSTPHVGVLVLMAATFTPACGGSQPSEPPAAPPPAPPPAMAPAAPVATTPPAAAPAASTAAPAAPPEKAEEHHHGMAGLFISSLKSIDIKPEQKAAVDGIESDIGKAGEQHKELGEKLSSDIADGVAAGKIDHAKTDADIKALTKAIEASAAGVQDAVNRLHKTLDPEQRKKFVETMRAKQQEMREHGMMGSGDHEHGMKGPGDHEHAKEGPADHEHAKEGPGAHEHGMHGPGEGEHGMHGPGGGEHGMAEHMAMLGDALGLSPEQKEKIAKKMEAQMKAKEATMKAKMAAAEKQMMAIGDAFETDKFDAKKAGVASRGPEMAKEMATGRISFIETVLAVLTPEQRPKFAAHLKEHASDMHDD
jgi:Spy/CpxP family protein refolding chaperone